MSALHAWTRALTYTKGAADQTLPGLIDELADRYAENPALLTADEIVAYDTMRLRINQYVNWAISQRFRPGDVVSLLMPNRIDYPLIWLALTRVGCTVALLNINLRGDALLHCIKAADSDIVIISNDLPSDQRALLVHNFVVLNWDSDRWPMDIHHHGHASSTLPQPRPEDCALLIYTSGTTGLPKATRITHRRIIEWSYWFAGMMDVQPTDRLYNCLPMYHSTGGVVAIGSMLVSGGSVFIKDRFSASKFWSDVYKWDCTIFQYIGELCRYLLASEEHPLERAHSLRLACGNGLQKDVWEAFQARFNVPQILEFYAASEGGLSLYNVEGKPGAIGRIPPFLTKHVRAAIIRCDSETGVPLRNEQSFCIRAEPDEPGEAISQIYEGRNFDGYTDDEASQRKLLYNVFAIGDCWFRTGDLMRRDAQGYFYFVDRLGDTFRWKGENVSTTEVANALRDCLGVLDAVVYGVVVPGQEGRAGMAALVTSDVFDFAVLSLHLDSLPEYARPLYVRLCPSLDVTGTFKLVKTDLARESYENASDPVWIRGKNGVFSRLVQ